jgi:molybdopterin/thiamine biosynthesis adenylyltransferase
MIDATRHRSIFDPAKWKNRVDVIGLGATGSKIALSLVKLGVRNLHVWDGDIVEAHNIANQIYHLEDVGYAKTTAFAMHMNQVAEMNPVRHAYWAPGNANLGEVVFCMVDSMKVRRELFEKSRTNLRTRLIIDSRMGSDHAQLLTYDPQNADSRKAYEATLFNDDDAHVEVSACGTAITVGPTGDIISGYAVWQFINYATGGAVEPEIVLGARVPSMYVASKETRGGEV